MTPTVSVIMPVYNAERHLDASAASVLGQGFRDFELILVDDGSTDRSAEIIAALGRRDPRVLVVRRQHRGQTASLIAGIRKASGRYIARQDADDVSLPDRFERQVRYLDARATVAVLGCAADVMDEHGCLTGVFPTRSGTVEVARGIRTIKATPVHSSVMMRREAYEEAGGYREAFPVSQDFDLWLRMLRRHGIDNLPDRLLRWRTSHQGVYATRRELQLRYGAVAYALDREWRRYGSDSYHLLERSDGDLAAFAAGFRLRGLLYARWGEMLFRGLRDPAVARRELKRAVLSGNLCPRTVGLYGWSVLGLAWPGGRTMPAISGERSI